MKLRSRTLLNAMRLSRKSALGISRTLFGKAAAAASDSARRSSVTPDLASLLRDSLPRAERSDPTRRARWQQDPGPPGTESTAADPSWAQHRHAGPIGARDFKLYIPKQLDDAMRPLVVMLHGCTQSAEDFARGTAMNVLAEELGFFVAYPEQPASANTSRCWNWFRADDQARDRGEPALIAGITRQLVQQLPVDATKVYVAGLSAGGAAAAIMAATYPDLYAAIGVHSGLAYGAASDMPSAFSAMRQGAPGRERANGSGHPVPAIVFHGDNDHTVSLRNARAVVAHAKGTFACREDVTRGSARGGLAYTRTAFLRETGESQIEQWIVHGAGHAWSGGSAQGCFTEPKGPDASREMLSFFLQHSRP